MEADSSSDRLNVSFENATVRELIEGDVSSTTSDNSIDSPRPVQIVVVNSETREFELDIDALSSILLRDKVRDKPVSVVSIAGDFRKGKSFLLNFFLKYLQKNGSSDWLSDENEPLKGSERDTTGILMWSEPFIVKTSTGKEIAILLMDTQGAFDSEYTVRDSATVFALSTMTSSIQIFNLLHNLQEDNLQVLEIFTEYGRLALEATDEKPFQKLVFLIRDWSFPYEHSYGLNGGQKLLEKKLMVKETQPPQLQRVRRHIRACFSEIDCFLMPHPGSKVATNPKFDGRISDIDSEFVDNLRILVPLVLDPKLVVLKEIGGQVVTGRQLLEYFKVYINIFKGETMPEPKSMLEATAEANNLAAVALAKDKYMNTMEDICGGNKPFLNPKILQERHEEVRQEAIETFKKARKMGGKEFSESYLQKLEEEILLAFDHFEAQNKSKNMFSILGSPAVLLVWCVICYIFSRIFELIGITSMANLFFLFGTVSLVVTIAYMFFRYGGTFPEFVQGMDAMAEQVWSFALDLSFKMMQNAVQNRTNSLNSTRSSNDRVRSLTSMSSPSPSSSIGLNAKSPYNTNKLRN
ncbi:atlastin-2-like protein [Dinothrombium tinctorium]|uniref:Atlastin-2-like protein n=1 Tax=Dinothrombium tinctorium TaxID=1965070 RepID=A0A3S3QDA1_9ACAR|nr:atlastin-2-like protein [Dinothrombium tinctorium]RWS17943.1 atlastin-2-like protein [Dinothrombium tinctorium]